jgi:hypothetical protein
MNQVANNIARLSPSCGEDNSIWFMISVVAASSRLSIVDRS